MDANHATELDRIGQLDVRNPYDNTLLKTVSTDNSFSVHKAIRKLQSYDYRLTAWQRYEILQRFSALLLKDKDQLALTISLESGKTLKDAQVEVYRAHQAFLLSSEEAKRICGEVVPLDAVAGMEKGIATVTREPIGIIAAITPFNYPLNLVAHKVGPALAANNPVILKPSESTPLTAMKMHQMLLQAGLPEEMLQLVVGDPVMIVDILCQEKAVRKISFTGSVAVGQNICRKAGLKSVSMELGGNDPMIILADADMDEALSQGIDGAFGNNGQRCTSVKRFIIEQSVADQFIARFVKATETLQVGDQLDPLTDVGPLINVEAADRIEQRILDSIRNGATLRTGGRRRGALLTPVVLDQVDMQHSIVIEETFGPVASFIRVRDFDQAIEVANDTEFALQSGVFTNDLAKAKLAAQRIQAGAVMINRSPGFRAEHLPFGGNKDSGIGREGIKYAVTEMTQLKTVVM